MMTALKLSKFKLNIIKSILILGILCIILYFISTTSYKKYWTINNFKTSKLTPNVYSQFVTTDALKTFTKYRFKSPASNKQLVIYAYTKKDLISRSLAHNQAWEFNIISSIDHLLAANPRLGLIDLGCNVGAFTISAASRGNKVVALDANLNNIMRVRRSLIENKLEHSVTLIHNALLDRRETVYMKLIDNNIGGSELSEKSLATRNTSVQSILLNDLLEVITFNSAIMKVDIQMREYHAFQHADLLFNKINITHVYIEWMYKTNPKHYEYLRKFFVERNYSPYGDPNNLREKLSNNMRQWPEECVIWKKNGI